MNSVFSFFDSASEEGNDTFWEIQRQQEGGPTLISLFLFDGNFEIRNQAMDRMNNISFTKCKACLILHNLGTNKEWVLGKGNLMWWFNLQRKSV